MVTHKSLIADYVALARLNNRIAMVYRSLGAHRDARRAVETRDQYMESAHMLKGYEPYANHGINIVGTIELIEIPITLGNTFEDEK